MHSHFLTMIAAKRFAQSTVLRPLCLAGLIFAVVLGTSFRVDRYAKQKISTARAVWVTSKEQKEERKIYPLSVIYGGAYSREELNRARRLDSVVGAHYADFGTDSVVKQNLKDLFMYVSYRRSDKIYWTRTKRRIPKGELVLSDSRNLARTRCGNRLSFTPQQPTLPEKEISEEILNTPEAPKIAVPFDAPPFPSTEADLYVPASPLMTDLFPPKLLPFAAPLASPASGSDSVQGVYAPAQIFGSGFSPWGTPLLAGIQLPARNGVASSATSSANQTPLGTPEPATTRLLLFSGLLFFLPALSRKLRFRQKTLGKVSS